MAIPVRFPDRSRRRLAQPEQRSKMVQPFANLSLAGGAVWPCMGLLSLPDILSTGTIGACHPDRICGLRGVVGFSTQGPLTFNPNVVCRSRFETRISQS